MDSLVLELQSDVLDRTIHLPDLLRKALLVSRKLKIKDIEEWLNDELNGYEARSVPSYRIITGELKAFNPYRGWIPVDMGGELHASVCEHPTRDSVSQIIDLVERTETGTVMVKFPADLNTAFRNLMRTDFEPALHVPIHKLVGILDVTKTKIMDLCPRSGSTRDPWRGNTLQQGRGATCAVYYEQYDPHCENGELSTSAIYR
ncbi:hypothetical protein [Pseudomonas sp. IT-P395]|uniref:AbiTii domain-containing protein n=1 Tax=Pseudomonas sp. IT-P395 TaxID=3026459 RepID=UPI0039DF7E3B